MRRNRTVGSVVAFFFIGFLISMCAWHWSNFLLVDRLRYVRKKPLLCEDCFPHRDLPHLWKEANDLMNQNELFPDDYDISYIIDALKSAKIVSASKFSYGTSIKWKITLEGGQVAIFKPFLTESPYEKHENCDGGFEQPRSEIAAFHMHRIFGIRANPYTVGRVISVNELKSVASIDAFNLTEHANGLCITTKIYSREHYQTICWNTTEIRGSLKYWINTRSRSLYNKKDDHLYHDRYGNDEGFLKMWIGNDAYCRRFRNMPAYANETVFARIIDFSIMDYIMSHMDSKLLLLQTGLIIVLDYGRAFCTIPENDLRNSGHLAMAMFYQCCRISRTMVEKLRKLQGNLAHLFDEMTKSDPLYPLLNSTELQKLDTRIGVVLEILDVCITIRGGYEHVIIDL